MSYFDKLKEKTEITKFLLYANFVQIGVIVFLIMMLTMSGLTKIINIEIPPGNLSGEKLAIGVNDANDRAFEVWSEVFSDKMGTFSPVNIEDKIKWLMPFFDRDKQFLIKTEMASSEEHIKKQFVTSDFKYKYSKIKRNPEGYVTAYAYGLMTRWVGKAVELDNMPYVFELDMKVRNGSIYLMRLNGHIDDSEGDNGQNKMAKNHKTSNRYVEYE